MYPFYEQLVKWSKNEPGHRQRLHPQGALPAVRREGVPAPARVFRRARRGTGGEGLAAAQFHHLPLRLALGGRRRAKEAWEHFEKTGRIEWVTDLAEIPEKYGVKNVYGDLGQLFAWTTTANPRLGAAIMGPLGSGPGRRPCRLGHRCGLDRRAAVADRGAAPPRDPGRHAEEVRLQTAGPADGPVKRMIFGETNARLYGSGRSSARRWRATRSRTQGAVRAAGAGARASPTATGPRKTPDRRAAPALSWPALADALLRRSCGARGRRRAGDAEASVGTEHSATKRIGGESVDLFLLQKEAGATRRLGWFSPCGTILFLHGSSIPRTVVFDLQAPGKPEDPVTELVAVAG